jgi:hypothetical protein
MNKLIPYWSAPKRNKLMRRLVRKHEIQHKIISYNTIWIPRWLYRVAEMDGVGPATIERACAAGPDLHAAIAALMELPEPLALVRELLRGTS